MAQPNGCADSMSIGKRMIEDLTLRGINTIKSTEFFEHDIMMMGVFLDLIILYESQLRQIVPNGWVERLLDTDNG